MKELADAIRETQVPIAADSVACPGCGAPVATPMKVIEEKGVDCSHCGSGVVATEGGVVLGDASLSLSMAPVEKKLKINRRRSPKSVEWRLRPEPLARPFTATGMILAGLGCGGTLAVAGVLLFIESAPWRAFGFIFAIIFVPLGLSLLIFMLVAAIGSHRVRLDAGVIEHEIRVLGLRVWRKVIPLARLLDANVKVTVSAAAWKIKTALRELSMELPRLNGEGALVSEELFEGIAERLREMERRVRIRRTLPPDPKKKGRSA